MASKQRRLDLVGRNKLLFAKMGNMMQTQVPTLSHISLFTMTMYNRHVHLQTQRCCLPDLFYNVVIFFDWQEHMGIYILKPYKKVQSRQYGPGMLYLSSHGLWLITIAKCGILCIRDVYTLVSCFLKKILWVYMLILYRETFYMYIKSCLYMHKNSEKILKVLMTLLAIGSIRSWEQEEDFTEYSFIIFEFWTIWTYCLFKKLNEKRHHGWEPVWLRNLSF